MSIAFVSASTGTDGSSSVNVTANAPSGIVAGNLLIAFVGTQYGGTSAPSGWTTVQAPSAGYNIGVYYKIATPSEPASYTFHGNGNDTLVILQYAGVNTTTPVDAYSANGSVSSGTSATFASVTTTAAGDVLLYALHDYDTNTWTGPAGLTARAIIAPGYPEGYVWEGAQASAGPSSTQTATCTATPAAGFVTVALLSAGGGSTAATATGSLSLSGSTLAAARPSAAGALNLSGSGTARFTLTATVTGNVVHLSWPTQGAVSYAVVRDGTTVAFGITATSYTDTPGNGDHTYQVLVLA